MTRKTAVGLCTLLIAAGCTDREDDTRLGSPEPGASSAAQIVSSSERSIDGRVRGTYDGKPFTAVVTIVRFAAQDGVLMAVGTLGSVAGELADATIDALEGQTFHFPVQVGPAVRPQVVIMSDAGPNAADAGPRLGTLCDVLYVRLAPLRLDVLGLVLDLETVTLDIDAAPGSSNLVGNLLCTVAGLLDPAGSLGGPTPANLQRSVELLNQLLTDAPTDGGSEQPAIDAGQNPAVSVDASIPIRF